MKIPDDEWSSSDDDQQHHDSREKSLKTWLKSSCHSFIQSEYQVQQQLRSDDEEAESQDSHSLSAMMMMIFGSWHETIMNDDCDYGNQKSDS